jgi:CubicO group peptidase (beta-lactamase class C family)
MLLNGGTLDGNQVLKADTVKLMSQNHIGDLTVTPLRTAIPEASNDFEPWSDQDVKWGLSFMINTQRTPDGRSPGSLAWAGLANTYYWLDPACEVGGVILTQILPFIDPKVMPLYSALERGVYQSLDGTKAAA